MNRAMGGGAPWRSGLPTRDCHATIRLVGPSVVIVITLIVGIIALDSLTMSKPFVADATSVVDYRVPRLRQMARARSAISILISAPWVYNTKAYMRSFRAAKVRREGDAGSRIGNSKSITG